MSNESKYRFWGKALKPPQFIDLNTWTVFKNSAADVLFGSFGFFNNSLIVSQRFTGIKDKNSKEIYFGDILKVGRDSDNTVVEVKEKNGQIFFNKSPAVWALGCIFGTDHYNECGIPEQLDECEVIGNIFENPELLNK